ncbi:MAG TPA: hypothetical protein VNL14_10755 [Candidatus Acidoferrales bacterium]|nr:hypothetical protein [Candidatus Acidoferrales bacterium]
MKELTIEELTEEAMRLLPVEIEELHVILGCQLLASTSPARLGAIMKRVAGARAAPNDAARAQGASLAELEPICEELKRDGVRFLAEVREDLRRALCTEDILALADEIDSSSMQIVVLIVGAILKLPPQIESISATVAAILCRVGLRNFCR